MALVQSGSRTWWREEKVVVRLLGVQQCCIEERCHGLEGHKEAYRQTGGCSKVPVLHAQVKPVLQLQKSVYEAPVWFSWEDKEML